MHIIIFLILFIILILQFNKVSKHNGSYLNSYTIRVGFKLLTIFPLLVNIWQGDNPLNDFTSPVILTFYLSLFIDVMSHFIGYIVGLRVRMKVTIFNKHQYLKYKSLSIIFYSIMVISFLLLGTKGIGVIPWLFNNRYAYIVGRKGVGQFYILFQLMLLTILVLTLNQKKIVISLFLPIGLSFFTGSKGFMLGLLLCVLYYYDLVFKRIKLKFLFLIGFMLVLFIEILLRIQSQTSLLIYAGKDFYLNYLNLLDLFHRQSITFFYGKLSLEEIVWRLVPRSLFPSKPFIYGHSVLVSQFYSEASIISGNTPSFTNLGVPFAEAGLFGIFIFSLFSGVFSGFIEKNLRYYIRNYCNFFALFIYINIFIVSPVMFSKFYLIIYIGLLSLFFKLFQYYSKRSRKMIKVRTISGAVFYTGAK